MPCSNRSPVELARRYEIQLEQTGIAKPLWNHYTKWLRYYWDFCHQYGHPPNEQQSFPPFDEKLRAKHQSESQRQQARQALSLYYGLVRRGPAWFLVSAGFTPPLTRSPLLALHRECDAARRESSPLA